MFAEQGSGTPQLCWRAVETRRRSCLAHAAHVWMIEFDNKRVGRYLRVGEEVRAAQDGGAGYLLGIQAGQPFGRGAGLDDFSREFQTGIGMFHPSCRCLKTRVVEPLRAFQRASEAKPFRV